MCSFPGFRHVCGGLLGHMVFLTLGFKGIPYRLQHVSILHSHQQQEGLFHIFVTHHGRFLLMMAILIRCEVISHEVLIWHFNNDSEGHLFLYGLLIPA